MKKPAILLAEREDAQRHQLQSFLLHQGFEVIESPDVNGVFHALRQERSPDLLIVNASLDAANDGVEVVQLLRRGNRKLPIILIATNSSEDLAIAALRAGVADYLKRPFSCEDLLTSVRRCLTDCCSQEFLSIPETTVSRLLHLIGENPQMQEIKAYLCKVASTDTTTLITGETGTGKELVAAFIHQNSCRRQKPFVCINCAAIPDGLLESELFGYERGAFTGAHTRKEGKLRLADGGTVFFDEIGDMSPYAQAKILRAIESREVDRLGGKESIPLDIRVIAATNRNLERLMAEEKFRADLFFRLNVASIHLPPLRDRKEDLQALCDYYICEMNRRFGREVEGFTEEAFAYLLRYEWPGNVRELKNLIEAIFVNLPSRTITLMDLPEPFRRRFGEADDLSRDERDRVLSILLSTNWNRGKAAEKLHWSRTTLYRKMVEYHLIPGGHSERRGNTMKAPTVPSSAPL
jgi:DNA-binding NtrC family response regulator